jgi:hypothetical protein
MNFISFHWIVQELEISQVGSDPMGLSLRPDVALPTNNAQGTPVPVEYPVRKRASVPSGIIIPLSKRNTTMTLADAVVGLMQGRDVRRSTAMIIGERIANMIQQGF